MTNGIYLVAHFVKLHKHYEGYASKIKQTKKKTKQQLLFYCHAF